MNPINTTDGWRPNYEDRHGEPEAITSVLGVSGTGDKPDSWEGFTIIIVIDRCKYLGLVGQGPPTGGQAFPLPLSCCGPWHLKTPM